MKAPIHRMSKPEIEQRYNERCKKHGHRYLEHWDCYLAEHGQEPRLGFFDIEASNLKADFGIILSYSLLGQDSAYFGDVITKKDLQGDLDKRIVTNMVADMLKFDVIVGYYSTRYDVPFARTRAHVMRIPFPAYGVLQHKDVYYIVKEKFSLSRKSQENAGRMLVGKTNKTRMMPEQWVRALGGHKESLDYIFDHNKRDVKDLRALYNEVIKYVKNGTKSL